jgi:hypothetical protein
MAKGIRNSEKWQHDVVERDFGVRKHEFSRIVPDAYFEISPHHLHFAHQSS